MRTPNDRSENAMPQRTRRFRWMLAFLLLLVTGALLKPVVIPSPNRWYSRELWAMEEALNNAKCITALAGRLDQAGLSVQMWPRNNWCPMSRTDTELRDSVFYGMAHFGRDDYAWFPMRNCSGELVGLRVRAVSRIRHHHYCFEVVCSADQAKVLQDHDGDGVYEPWQPNFWDRNKELSVSLFWWGPERSGPDFPDALPAW